MDFCNESDTPPDRVSGADFPKRFSPLLSFIADVREKQFLSPNLERSRREIKAAAVAVVGASLMIRGMDRVWRAGEGILPRFLRPPEFLPLSDSSYAENDFTPSDNNSRRPRITFVVVADRFSRNVRHGERLSLADGRTDGLLTFLAKKMSPAERERQNCILVSTGGSKHRNFLQFILFETIPLPGSARE